MSAERHQPKPPKPATARVFFALWPAPEVADGLAEIARRAALSFGGRPTRGDTIHLTLAFLGNVLETRLDELSMVARQIAVEPFTIRVDRLGFWQHNHLLWAGCQLQGDPLIDLFSRLRTALADAGFRTGREDRAFAPHVTLVRHVPEATAPDQRHPLPAIEPSDWHCDRFVLVRSTLAESGSTYRIIESFPLSVATK